jgi:hypothetical protein
MVGPRIRPEAVVPTSSAIWRLGQSRARPQHRNLSGEPIISATLGERFECSGSRS